MANNTDGVTQRNNYRARIPASARWRIPRRDALYSFPLCSCVLRLVNSRDCFWNPDAAPQYPILAGAGRRMQYGTLVEGASRSDKKPRRKKNTAKKEKKKKKR
ncbi:hypothetical protein PUN28_012275 [Cardiocondyla obscurior]|uniref:Uncharacterized protein n=1 Tax=Cardiocondyla obscurior TaxID=286306 RepID=A0AAW2FBM6_9HYME